MSEPVLFYSPGTCSLTIQVALDWLQRPHWLCRAEKPKRELAAFRAVNPHGKVPALRTADGRLLSENSAILLHLAAGTPWIPEVGTAAHDELQVWLSYLGSGFHAAFYPWFNPQRYVDDPSLEPSAREAARGQIRKELAFVNEALRGRTWLMTPEPGLLDPYLFAMSRWANRAVDLPEEFPEVHAHQERTRALPAVQRALAIEADPSELPPGGSALGHVGLEGLGT